MNHSYKSIWNEQTRTFVAVSELSSSKGKKSGSQRTINRGLTKLVGGVALATGLSCMALAVQAAGGTNGNGLALSGNCNAASAAYVDDIAIGCNAIASEDSDSFETGEGVHVYNRDNPYNSYPNEHITDQQYYSIAVGSGAEAYRAGTSIGAESESKKLGIAIGVLAKSEKTAGIAIGPAALATGNTGLALGRQSVAKEDFAQAIGNVAAATGKGSLAMGHSATATGYRAIAIGSPDIEGAGNTGYQLGTKYQEAGRSLAEGDDSIALGSGAKALKENALAIGSLSQATDEKSLALGAGAKSTHGQSVALGANSITDIAIGSPTMTVGGTTYQLAGSNPTSTVSIGSKDNERTLTHVAAGRVSQTSTDAINGSQLHATNQAVGSLEANQTRFYSVNSTEASQGNYNNDGATGSNAMAAGVNAQADGYGATALGWQATASASNSMALGREAKALEANAVAIGREAQALGAHSIALGESALAEADNSMALGREAKATAVHSTAIGRNAQAGHKHSVALGANSITDIAIETSTMTIGGTTYQLAGSKPTSTVSIGSKGNERTLTHVAAGRVSETSTDAINGSQLHATNTALTSINTTIGQGLKFSGNMGGEIHRNLGEQLNIVGGMNDLEKVAASSANLRTVKRGDELEIQLSKNLTDLKTVTVDDKLTVAGDTVLDKDGIVTNAVTTGDTTMNNEGITIGSDVSITNQGFFLQGGPSISVNGINAGGMRITNVQAGIDDNDAVNVSQLTTVEQSVGDLSDRAVTYDGKVGDPKNTITLAGGADGTTITNLADGKIESGSKDAVNGGQIHDMGDSIAQGMGGNSKFENGKLVTDLEVAGNRYNNVNDALGGVHGDLSNKIDDVGAAANAGWNVTDAKGNSSNIGPNGAVKFTGDDNISVAQTGSDNNGQVEVTLNKDLNVNSITTIDLNVSNKVTANEVAINSGPVINEKGIDMSGKKITGLAKGTAPTDAVNVSQLDDVRNDFQGEINSVRDDVNKVDRKLRAGVAAAMASAALPQAYMPGKSMVAMGGGTWSGESGVALGVSKITDNGKWVFKVSGNAGTRGDYGGTVGAGYQW